MYDLRQWRIYRGKHRDMFPPPPPLDAEGTFVNRKRPGPLDALSEQNGIFFLQKAFKFMKFELFHLMKRSL